MGERPLTDGLAPQHDEKFRMMLERLVGYCTMHGRDMHKDPDAWGETVRSAHLELVRYAEEKMVRALRASPPPDPGATALLDAIRTALGTMQKPMEEMGRRCVLDMPHDHGHLKALRAAMKTLQDAHDAALAALASPDAPEAMPPEEKELLAHLSLAGWVPLSIRGNAAAERIYRGTADCVRSFQKRALDAERALASARKEARAVGLDEAARVADHWAAQYPTDIFPPESTSLDAKAAGHGRHVAKEIAKDVRALSEHDNDEPGATPSPAEGRANKEIK